MRARRFAEQELKAVGVNDSSIVTLSFGLFSVDDARRLIDTASLSGSGGHKVIIASMTRIFHEAQNALLKILEEPPEGALIILCVPSEGIFIPTLRSRLLPLPTSEDAVAGMAQPESVGQRFMAASVPEREKIVGKLVEQAKSDKDELKQQARREAIEILQALTEVTHDRLHQVKTKMTQEEARHFLEDLASFMPILYERSAPLKLIFEHLLLVIPKGLGKARV